MDVFRNIFQITVHRIFFERNQNVWSQICFTPLSLYVLVINQMLIVFSDVFFPSSAQ